MPGTAVAIGLNSPRISAGESGFISRESRWLKPPVRLTRRTDFTLPSWPADVDARKESGRGIARPIADPAPIFRKSRRASIEIRDMRTPASDEPAGRKYNHTLRLMQLATLV